MTEDSRDINSMSEINLQMIKTIRSRRFFGMRIMGKLRHNGKAIYTNNFFGQGFGINKIEREIKSRSIFLSGMGG